MEEYSITKPSESKMSMIVEKNRVQTIITHHQNDIITNYKMLFGIHENVLQNLPSPLSF